MGQSTDIIIPAGYGGRILHGDYSVELKQRVLHSLRQLADFECFGLSPLLYVAAWHEQEKIIWYEFMADRLLSILACNCEEAAERFRFLVQDQRTYSCREGGLAVKEEIIPSGVLRESGENIREKRLDSGRMEAIYKMDLAEISWLKDSSVLETWKEDEICLSFGCLTDVSKEMEQKDQLFQENVIVNRDKSILVKAERTNALDNMTARLCHEIRNPIASMGGLVKRLLKFCKPEDKIGRYLLVIDQEVARLEKILIGFSEYNSSLALTKEVVLPNDLLRSVLGLLKTEMEQDHIKVSLYSQGDLPELFVDRKLLEEALLHILKNSMESLPAGGDIECRLERQEQNFRIIVKDQGMGIQENMRAKIFEPFFTTKVYGTGLGLTMAKKVVELHGGKLDLQSSRERGTRVIIDLPC